MGLFRSRHGSFLGLLVILLDHHHLGLLPVGSFQDGGFNTLGMLYH